MKVIATDNFNRETVSDYLVCENINERYGRRVVDMLNHDEGPSSPRFYRLVDDAHVLYAWEP